MKNVLVIGAGRRVKGAVLPALGCLEDRYRVAAVVARSARELSYAGGRRKLVTVNSLDRVNLAGIDLIAMAVSITMVPRVLAQLAGKDVGHAVLLHRHAGPSAHGARGLALLPGVPAGAGRRGQPGAAAISGGAAADRVRAIGALRRIFFFHNGFKHHALASLKLLAGGARIRRIVNRKFAGKLRQKQIELEGGVSAVMYEPRDYASGKFLLLGDRRGDRRLQSRGAAGAPHRLPDRRRHLPRADAGRRAGGRRPAWTRRTWTTWATTCSTPRR